MQIDKSVNWTDYESNVTEINVPLDTATSPEDYLYGVAMDMENGNSGFSWQSCVYIRHVGRHSDYVWEVCV